MPGNKGGQRRPAGAIPAATALILIFALALALRMLFIYQFKDSPAFGFYSADARYYDKFALKILGGDLAYKGSAYLNPLYPFFLAAIYRIFGHSLVAVAFCQAALDSCTALILYVMCSAVFRRKAVAVVSSLIYACYAPALFYTGLVTEATLAAFLLSAFIMCTAVSDDRGSGPLWALAAGAALGLAQLVRPNAVFVAPAAVLWLFLRRTRTSSQNARRVMLMAAGAVLVMMPFVVRSEAMAGKRSPNTENGGISFFIGNNPAAAGNYVPLKGVPNSPVEQLKRSIELAGREAGRTLSAEEASAHWFKKGLGFIRDDPVSYLKLVVRKALLFWNKAELPLNEDYELCGSFAPVLGWPLASFGLAAPFALLGIAIVIYRKLSGPYLAAACVIAYMASLVVFFVTSRYRFPCIPVMAALSAFGACEAAALLARPRLGRALVIVPALAASFAFVNIDIPLPGGGHSPAANHNNLGVGHYERGELAEAIAEYEKAIALDPACGYAYSNLGSALYRRGERERAVASFEKAIALDPGLAQPHYCLAGAYSDTGEYARAIPIYKKAIELDPDLVEAYNGLAYAYIGTGNAVEAEEMSRRAIAADPRYAAAYNNLGIICARTGRMDEARMLFRKAVELKPDYADARKNLERASAGSGAEEAL